MVGRLLSLASLLTALLACVPGAPAVPARRTNTGAGMFANPKFVPPPHVAGPRWVDSAPKPSAQAATSTALTPPVFAVYSDQWVSGENGPPAVSSISGFNVFIMSFLMASGPADQGVEWVSIGAASRASIKAAYAAAGVKLMISAFGSTDAPTSGGYDPVALANTMSAWVIQYSLDGIDVDYEDFNAMNAQDGKAEAWLEAFTKQLRVNLPQGQYIITHAPVAPWFSAGLYKTGAYSAVNAAVGSLIDWYNVQFYNQGTTEYTTCAGLLTASSSKWPNTAVFQLAAGGLPLNKIVIGKPGNSGSDADNGYIAPATLAQCVQQAKGQGWSGGVMAWQFPHADAVWISSVRSLSWPAPALPVTTTKTTTTSTKTTSTKTSTSTKPAATGCSTLSAWNPTTTYVGGDAATYGSPTHRWNAQWWTLDDVPGSNTNPGVWIDAGTC